MSHHVYALVMDTQVHYVGYTAYLNQRSKTQKHHHPEWHLLVLGTYPTRESGLEQEKRWIKRLSNLGHPLINISAGGNANGVSREVSFLTRKRMSASLIGRRHSKETRAKISMAKTGSRASDEARANMSAAQLGNRKFLNHRHSEETKAKIGAANRGRRLGCHHSEATKAKISAAIFGLRRSDETKARISIARKGKSWTETGRKAEDKDSLANGTAS